MRCITAQRSTLPRDRGSDNAAAGHSRSRAGLGATLDLRRIERFSPVVTLIILAGHAVFTLPFMVRSVMAVFGAIDVKTLDEGAASLGAWPWRRFRDVIVPNAAPGILAGSLMVVSTVAWRI